MIAEGVDEADYACYALRRYGIRPKDWAEMTTPERMFCCAVIDMEKLEKRTMPSLTWRINEEKAEVRGETDELDAMRQAVSKILQTERYRYAVYDWNYGVELEDLYGKNVSYVIPELKRRIEDALLADDRVTAVTDFSFREEKGSVTAAFTVYTIFGEVTAERTVDI